MSANYFGEKENGYFHGPGVLIEHNRVFEGIWEKGLRVQKGTFKYDDKVLNVKFKKGKIYKLISFQSKTDEKLLVLKQINYIQEGDYYLEVPGNDVCSFWVIENIVVFDGFPLKDLEVGISRGSNFSIYQLLNYNTTVKEVRMNKIRFISRFLNNLPLGTFKAIKDSKFSIKGFVIGYNFVGELQIKRDNLKLIAQETQSSFPNKFKLISKEDGLIFTLETEDEGVKIIKQKNRFSNDDSFFHRCFVECLEFYNEVFNCLLKFSSKNKFMMNSIKLSTNLLDFEKTILLEENIKRKKLENRRNKLIEGNKKDANKIDENENILKTVKRIKYPDGTIYYGEMKNDLRDGLGCLIFSNGSRYKGYFKGGLFCGKGYFENNSLKISGIWENNRIKRSIVLRVF